MRKQNRSSQRRSYLVLGSILMFAVPTVACTTEEPSSSADARLGREKRVIFSSGCTSSVTMPVGASETISLQAAQENVPLPPSLFPQSADPSVIEVSNATPNSFDMHALKQGHTDIEVLNGSTHYDVITFYAEPAKVVKFMAEPTILAGGRTGLAISDVFGACGTDECPLFGHTFMKWSADPASSFTFLEDTKNLAHYTASTTPGKGAMVGNEPSAGGELVRHTVEIVDPAMITSISGMWKNDSTSDGQESSLAPFPVTVPIRAFFEVRLSGERAGETSVPISWHDIEWTVPMGLAQVPLVEPADPFSALFVAQEMTGAFTITAKIALLGGQEQQFVVNVTP